MKFPLLIATLLFLALGGAIARAGEMTAEAIFPERTGEVGVSIDFQIRISGMEGRVKVPEIVVDGLDFRLTSQQQGVAANLGDFGNSGFVRTLVLDYDVTAKRPGTFTVPALQIQTATQRASTKQVAIKIQGAGTPSVSVRAEIDLEKKTVYVGEVLPMETRLIWDPAIRLNLDKAPEFEGDAFTVALHGKPEQTQMEVNQQTMGVVIFRYLVTPIRAGKANLGAANFDLNVSTPLRRGRRGMDPFNDPFNLPPFMDQQWQQRKVAAPALPMQIKPLPTTGRPKSFSGAVGQFSFGGQSAPDRVKIDSPLSVKLVIAGKGNFERMSAPVLASAQGWRVYPPSEDLKMGKDGLNGTKTFEISIIPEAKKTEIPPFEFSYFDPASEKYVTLKSAPLPLTVEGEPKAATPAPVLKPTPESKAPAAPTDILGPRYDAGEVRTFRPLYTNPIFLGAQGVPVVALLGWAVSRMRRPDDGRRKLSALRRERAGLLAQLRREDSRPGFYDTAARILQVEAAIHTGRVVETVDVALARRLVAGDAEAASAVDEIFEARAELLYAGARGAGGASTSVSEEERDRALRAIEAMGKAVA